MDDGLQANLAMATGQGMSYQELLNDFSFYTAIIQMLYCYSAQLNSLIPLAIWSGKVSLLSDLYRIISTGPVSVLLDRFILIYRQTNHLLTNHQRFRRSWSDYELYLL